MKTKVETVKDHLEEELKDPQFRKVYELEGKKLRLGAQINHLRRKQNMTQVELAKKAGVTQGYIARLERAELENYELKTLKRIAAALDAHFVYGFVEDVRHKIEPRKALVA